MKKVDQIIPRRDTTLYTPEFRDRSVKRFLAGKLSSPAFADSIGVNRETFRRWVKKARRPGQTVSSQVLELRAEVAKLRERVRASLSATEAGERRLSLMVEAASFLSDVAAKRALDGIE